MFFKTNFYILLLLSFIALFGFYSAQEFEVDETETKTIEKKWSIDEVVKVSHESGIGTLVVKVVPFGVIKG